MATKKKSNYIGYELDWLEERCLELREWVQSKLQGGIKDRIEVYPSQRGNPIIKVISSEETQIKTLRDTLKELPSMLMEINRLRKLVEGEEAVEKDVRGDHEIPGFMEDDDDDDVEVIEKPKRTKNEIITLNDDDDIEDADEFDDADDDFEDP